MVVPTEKAWPFDPATVNEDPRLDEMLDAARFVVKEIYRIEAVGSDRVRAVMAAIAAGYPVVFGTEVDTVPWRGSYLRPDPAKVAKYREALAGRPGRKIGVCWSSGIRIEGGLWLPQYGRRKSMSLETLRPALAGLDPEPSAAPPVRRWR